MASTLAFLLHLEPTQAIVRMLNDANGTNYRLDRFTASAPMVVAGTTTKVTLSSVEVPAYIDDQITTGSIDFTYERLELSVFLKGVLDGYHPTLPCSTQTLLDEIKARINQSFYGDDILLQELTRDNGVQYVLTAKPESLRFVGSITLPLLQVVDISTLFDPNLIASSTASSPYVPDLDNAAAYITGTDILNQDATIGIGAVVQTPSVLLQVIQQQVPDPVTGQYHAPWYADSSAPGPYNLYGSVVQYRGTMELPGTMFQYEIPGTSTHVYYTWPELCNTAIPTLDSAIVLAVNPSYCTNFKGTLTIPYSSADFNYTPSALVADKVANPGRPDDWFEIPGDGFVAKPRLTHNSVVSLSNGTTWQNYLNANWSTGDVIYSFQATPPITMDGSSAWVATVGGLTYTNLYGATVVYNGQLRAEDLPPATVGLDRVMVVDFTGSDNSLWTGQYPFYYQSPIELSGTSFISTVGSAVHIELLAATEGTNIKEVAADGSNLGDGVTNLPPGLELSGDELSYFVDGTPTTEGSYTYYLLATSGSISVFFTISHVVKTAISALSLQGDLTPAMEGDEAWVSYIDIEGGLAPYTLGTITGDLPTSITVEIQYDTVHLYGTWVDNGLHHFNIEVSSTDNQTISRSFDFQASGTALGVTASASLNDSYNVGATVVGNYTVVGGQAPYTYQVTSGTFPPGLLLNGGTGNVSSSLTANGTYTWTVTVTSSDGYSGSVSCTLISSYHYSTLDASTMTSGGTGGTLSTDLLQVTKTTGGGSFGCQAAVPIDDAKTNGKWYFEGTIEALTLYGSGGSNNLIGLVGSIEGSPGHSLDVNSAVPTFVHFGSNAYSLNGSSHSGTTFVLGAVGATVGIAVDLETGNLWIRNSSGWAGGGDPASGTIPLGTLSASVMSGGVRPYVGTYSYTGSYRINLGQSAFQFPVPAGFFAGWTTNG